MSRSVVKILYVLACAAFLFPNVLRAEGEKEGPAQEGVYVYDDHGKRDPFWPLVTSSGMIVNYDKEVFASEMVLEGVMLEPTGANLAIINGMVVTENDSIGMYVVQKIEANAVILLRGDETVTLKLKKEE